MILLTFIAVLSTQDATTTCREFGGMVTCNTFDHGAAGRAAQQGAADAMRSAEEASARAREQEARLGYIPGCAGRMWLLAGCSRAQHDAAVSGIARKGATAALRQSVTSLLADGDCQGAVQAALRGGDMDLARSAREFCPAKP